MDINMKFLENTINNMVSLTLEKMDGKCEPTITEGEALKQLGIISEFVLHLYDEIKDENVAPELKEKVWKLKEKSDTAFQKIMKF